MATYIIGMTFVGWLVAFLMLFGLGFIKMCEKYANDPTADDSIRMGADAIIQDYNSRNLGGRIALILFFATKLFTGKDD